MSDNIFLIKDGLFSGDTNLIDMADGLIDGWYFYDGESEVHGPFSIKTEAVKMYSKYCENLLDYGGVKSWVVNSGKKSIL
jgi:hypothetical protein